MEKKEIRKDGLLVKGDIDALPSETMEKLLRCFDEVFPAIWEKFGAGEKPTIVYEIKRSYKGIAYTAGDHIGLNPGWLVEHPNDIDCMTHELIHAAQGYPHYDPSWLVEGIADYGRDLFGQYNEDAGWHLPRHYRGGKLTDGYGTTAAFLKYVETLPGGSGLVDACNRALQEDRYTPAIFSDMTGKSIEELWADYTKAGENGD